MLKQQDYSVKFELSFVLTKIFSDDHPEATIGRTVNSSGVLQNFLIGVGEVKNLSDNDCNVNRRRCDHSCARYRRSQTSEGLGQDGFGLDHLVWSQDRKN